MLEFLRQHWLFCALFFWFSFLFERAVWWRQKRRELMATIADLRRQVVVLQQMVQNYEEQWRRGSE